MHPVFKILGLRHRAADQPATFVPLRIGEALFGVLGVFSNDRFHYYSSNDIRKLYSMAPLIAMAQKNAKFYGDLKSRDLENNERLKMFYEIGEQFKAEQGLEPVFRNVVKLVS